QPRRPPAPQAIEHRTLARAAVPVVRKTRDPQGGKLRNELVGKFLTNPILRDNGGNLCLQEGPDPPQKGLVFLAQGQANGVEIAIGLWKRLLCRNTHGHFLLIGCPLPRTSESELWRKAPRMLLPPCFNFVRHGIPSLQRRGGSDAARRHTPLTF